jgi:cytochrome c553
MKEIRPHHLFDAVVWTAGLMFLLVLAVHEAHAGEHSYDNANAAYRAECGSCHVAYPPALLAAPGWNRMLASLDRHFGTDASVDAAALRSIRAFVSARANPRDSAEPSAADLPRISRRRWFVKEHREVAQRWSDPNVKSAANCAACHARAADGDFSESTLRVPR